MNKRLLLIIFIGLVLRLVSLNQSFWLDEATSVLVARDLSFSGILTRFSLGDFHPPLYYLMLKIWVSFFGSGEVAARLLSVAFGVATIYLVYLIALELAGRVTPLHKQSLSSIKSITLRSWPLLSALLLATAPLHIYYSQEARMYVPATLFAAVSVLFFLKLLGKNGDKPVNWLGLVLSATALLYTDYLPGFLFLFFALYLLSFERGHLKKHAKKWLVSVGSVLILFVPWIPTLFKQFQSGLLVKTTAPQWWKILGRTNFKQLALVPLKFTIGRIPVEGDLVHVFALSVPGAFFSGLLLKAARGWRETKFLWLWLLVPTAAVAILGLRLSVLSYFRLIFILPAFYLLLAYGVLSLKNHQAKILAVLGILLVNLVTSGIYLFNPRLHREDWRGAVRFIEENSQGKNAAAVFVSRGQQEAYSYYSRSIPGFSPQAAALSFDTIWLMRYVQSVFDPEDEVRKSIEARGYEKVGEYDFNGVVVWEYQR